MKLVCPKCHASYELAPAALGPGGRSVRCCRCQNVWFAEPPMVTLGVALPGTAGRTADLPGRTPAESPAERSMQTEQTAKPMALANPEPPSKAAAERGAPPSDDEILGPASAAFAEAAPSVVETSGSSAAGPPTPAPPEAGQPAPDADTDGAAAPDGAAEASPDSAAEEPSLQLEDIESIAARRDRLARQRLRKPRKREWQIKPLTAAILVLAVVDLGIIVWRKDVVRVLPQTASLFADLGLPVNLRSLAFRDIQTTYVQRDGVPILVVKGKIVATGTAVVDVPRLRFAIDSANGHELYAWTAQPKQSKLAPGETLAFNTRLASPPEQGRTIQVRFLNQLDVASGLH